MNGVGDIAESADEFLVEQIRSGDETAWRQLIGRYEGRLRAFARSRLRGADADDVVQEAFLGFVQSLPRYDISRSLETYLFSILRYKIGDVCRRKRLPTPADFGLDADAGGDPFDRAGPAETPSHIARQHESLEVQRTLLADALRALIRGYGEAGKLRDLQVIELLFFAGRRNKDIAEHLDMDEKAVAGIKFRAIRRLHETIETADADVDVATIEELTDEASVARVWRERRLSCLKRSTLGAYQLGVLDEPWQSYVRQHLEVVACPYCLANLDDIDAEAASREQRAQLRERIFASSVGFLRSVSTGG